MYPKKTQISINYFVTKLYILHIGNKVKAQTRDSTRILLAKYSNLDPL